ncbi:HAD family hydrolase [Neobacillus niacini]|uniref:HAD family hydrolase n=1 Tax=Neobacillus niacini TaxID=86668 RepID=UPI0021CB71DA|nr:HAD family hydrolase [Neobacillus niacini]MCM3764761.1 HAD family hydrolase [Neobacillus niacini]
MKRKKFKLIAFDLGYTLAYNRREEYYMKFLEQEGVSIPRKKVDMAYHLADKTFMREFHGVLGRPRETYMPWYIGLVNYFLNKKFDILKQVNFIYEQSNEVTDYWQPFPWTVKVLETLKNQGYRLALLSNWDLSCRAVLKQIGVYDYFEHILVSSEVQISKPDARIFQKLIELSDCRPDEILYVGDNYYDDVIGARKAGIDTVLINRFGGEGIDEIDYEPLVEDTFGLIEWLVSGMLKNNMKP